MRINWTLLKEILEAASFASVFFAITLGYFEYKNNLQSQKIERTMDFVRTFYSLDYRADKDRIESIWLSYDVKKLAVTSGNLEAVDAIVGSISRKDPGFEKSLIKVTEFLDLIGYCVKNELCDGGASANVLVEYTSNLFCLYHPTLEAIRERSSMPSLGVGSSTFVRTGRCER